jgi:benzodiazapine receptor
MGTRLNALLNVAGLVLVLMVNALANILPINGYNTGQISGFYPNFFVPAGYTFGIWGIIYFLLIGFVFCSLFAAFGKFNEAANKAINNAGPYFLVTCLLNAGWIVAWHYLYLGLSLVIMISFLVSLVLLFLSIRLLKNEMPFFYRLWVYHPFLVYLGWISVAAIANVTAFLVGIGWQGEPLSPQTWSIIMILIALLLGIFMVGKLKQPAFGFVLAWAFFGIYSKQTTEAWSVGVTAGAAACFILSLTLTILFRFKKASIAA